MDHLKMYLKWFYRILQGCIAETSASANSWGTVKICTNEKHSSNSQK